MVCVIQIENNVSMKILFVAPSAYILGGVQDWLYMLVLELRKLGNDIIVAIPRSNYHNGVLYNEYYQGINAVYFSSRTVSHEGRLNALSQLLLDYPVDVIAGVNIGDIYEAYKKVRDKIKPSRIIMTLHAIEIEYLRDIGKYCHILDGVITTNKLTQQMITNLGLLDENRVLYAPYGVHEDKNIKEKNIDNILRIAWVGRLDNEQKRVSDLVKIMEKLEVNDIGYKLSIAGDGPAKILLEEELKKEIRKSKVELVGFLNKKKLSLFYRDHDILLITSEWETGPIVAWEAMLSGLVLVSSTYVGSRLEGALINEETALLFPIGSNEAAVEQLSRLVDPRLREKLSKNAQQMARSRYSLSISLVTWEQAFQKIVSLKPLIKDAKLKKRFVKTSGRLDSLLGSRIAEFIRLWLNRKGYCRDPGSEWPHSSSSKTTLKPLLEYAKSLEQNA
jgi:glycosyltransferase involved in cell wall biosynthesis